MTDRPQLLLVHNAGADMRSWGPVVARLSDEFACRTIGLSGHPGADRDGQRLSDHASEVVDALEQSSGPALLVGHCVGAAAALEATRRRTSAVLGLALLSPASERSLSHGPWRPVRSALKRVPTRRILTAAVAGSLRLSWVRRGVARFQVGPPLGAGDAVRLTRAQLTRPGTAERLAELLQDFSEFGAVDAPLPAPRPPVGLMWGSRNRVLPLAGLRDLEASLQPDLVRVIAGAGHLLPLEVPDEVAAFVRAVAALR